MLTAAAAAFSQSAAHTCTCRANNRDYKQGQMTCIRGVMAKCGMSLNNSSWIMSDKPCPLSSKPVLLIRLSQARQPQKACTI